MVVCSICGNDFVRQSGISFHRFPGNMNKKEHWLTTIQKKIKNFTRTEHSVLCSQHFTEDCFTITSSGKRYLKPNAVPSVFNMPLKKHYELLDQQEQEFNTDNVTTSTIEELSIESFHEKVCPKSNHEDSISQISTNIIKQTDSLQKSYVPTSRAQRTTKFGTIHSGTINISNLDKNKLYEEKKVQRLRAKLELYEQECRKLEKKVTSLTSLIKDLQNGKVQVEDAAKLLEESYG